jgi:hypothetical protein
MTIASCDICCRVQIDIIDVSDPRCRRALIALETGEGGGRFVEGSSEHRLYASQYVC